MLSFFSIFGIQNNYNQNGGISFVVVNCFHFSVSLGYKTTKLFSFKLKIMLWIAFIFQYLWDTKQHTSSFVIVKGCCELLSFFSIFGIQNNSEMLDDMDLIVVNCFHFSVSLGYKTTHLWNYNAHLQLWIAFIFQYLWDTKQLRIIFIKILYSCELLSFFSIFGIQNNKTKWKTKTKPVVNCFHFSVSLGYKTTLMD